MISILLAFAVQAWWEQRQERRLEVERLAALRIEVADVVQRVPEAERVIEGTMASHEALLRQFPGATLASADSLIFWLGAIGRPNAFAPPQAVLGDLLSSGAIQGVESDALRLAIADYQSSLNTQAEQLEVSWDIWVDRIQPYLEGRVSRIDRLRLGPYATNGGASVPFAPSPFEPDYMGLFGDRVFESMLAERWMRLQQASLALSRIETAGTVLLGLIDQDLGRE